MPRPTKACGIGEMAGDGYCRQMRKWTVRIADDIADEFAQFCQAAGISIQGGLEAGIRVTVERFLDNDRRPPELWEPFDQPTLHRWLGNVELARAIDAARRAKRPYVGD